MCACDRTQVDISCRLKNQRLFHAFIKSTLLELLLSMAFFFPLFNRYSMFEQKRVFWQFEVEGAEDAVRDEKEEIDNSLAEFQETAKFTRRKISLVSTQDFWSRLTLFIIHSSNFVLSSRITYYILLYFIGPFKGL